MANLGQQALRDLVDSLVPGGVGTISEPVPRAAYRKIALDMVDSIMHDTDTGITANAGGGQGSATALTADFNNVTIVATAGDSVKLLTASGGLVQQVKNSGATMLEVFPNSSDKINAQSANLSVEIEPGGTLTFYAIDDVTWETVEDVTGVLAAAGTTKADAAIPTQRNNVITGVDGATGVGLRAAAVGESQTYTNTNSVFALKVYTVISGNDVINGLATDEAFLLGPGQTAKFRATSATQYYVEKAASDPSRATHARVFDDFGQAAIQLAGVGDALWKATAGNGTSAAVAVIVVSKEGTIVMTSGSDDGTEDGSVLSSISLSQGALISDGLTTYEVRVKLSDQTGVMLNIGLGDKLSTTDEHNIHGIVAGTVTDGGLTMTDGITFAFATEANAPTKWQFTYENNTAINQAGAEEASALGPTNGAYDTLRIEIDPTGDARWYINGELVNSQALAVATNAVLIPYICVDGEDGTAISCAMTIDYIEFNPPRPA